MSEQTEANCSEETIDSYFRMLTHYEEEIEDRQAKIQQLMSILQLEAGRTFQYKGQIYQVCQRKKEGTYFFKMLDKPPKAWLGRKAREARRYRSEKPIQHGSQACGLRAHACEHGDTTEADASPEGATVTALVTE